MKRSEQWTLAVVLLVAIGAIGVGVAQGWQALLREPATPMPGPELPGENASQQAAAPPPTAKAGRFGPGRFGLPELPGAFRFTSRDFGGGTGSSAFRVKTGTAEDAVRYYITRFGELGYELLWQRSTSTQPGGAPAAAALRGKRVRWVSPDRARQVTLLALDDPQPTHRVQAVLSWSPVQQGEPKP